MSSIYIHIPFCKSICSYCDFSKMLYNEGLVERYMQALKNEIEDTYEHEVIDTLYVGGGTPSALSSSALDALNKIISMLNLSDNCEFTFECNVQDIDMELLSKLKLMGVNRLSIGIESFNKKKLEFMDRDSDFDDVSKKVQLARDVGFANISVDLMYGIPGEKLSDLK